jgi:hypothetical protein
MKYLLAISIALLIPTVALAKGRLSVSGIDQTEGNLIMQQSPAG